jgi:hypothetical protein
MYNVFDEEDNVITVIKENPSQPYYYYQMNTGFGIFGSTNGAKILDLKIDSFDLSSSIQTNNDPNINNNYHGIVGYAHNTTFSNINCTSGGDDPYFHITFRSTSNSSKPQYFGILAGAMTGNSIVDGFNLHSSFNAESSFSSDNDTVNHFSYVVGYVDSLEEETQITGDNGINSHIYLRNNSIIMENRICNKCKMTLTEEQKASVQKLLDKIAIDEPSR